MNDWFHLDFFIFVKNIDFYREKLESNVSYLFYTVRKLGQTRNFTQIEIFHPDPSILQGLLKKRVELRNSVILSNTTTNYTLHKMAINKNHLIQGFQW